MKFLFWTAVNLLLLVLSMIYIRVLGTPDSSTVAFSKIVAQLAVILFLVNISLYFFIRLIKSSKHKKVRSLLAKCARVMMKHHKWIALAATLLIIVHAGMQHMMAGPAYGYMHPKLFTGYAAMLLLILTLIGGYRRSLRASGFRRKFHLSMALLFGILFLIHLFL